MEVLVLIGWGVMSLVNAWIADEKGRSAGGALACSVFLSPVPVYLYLLAVPVLVIGSTDNA